MGKYVQKMKEMTFANSTLDPENNKGECRRGDKGLS